MGLPGNGIPAKVVGINRPERGKMERAIGAVAVCRDAAQVPPLSSMLSNGFSTGVWAIKGKQ